MESARCHGVPQTTVRSWLHRDATKAALSKGGAMNDGEATERKTKHATRRPGSATTTAAKVAPKAAVRRKTKPMPQTVDPEVAASGRPASELGAAEIAAAARSSRKQVACSYAPSQKAQVLEHTAAHGVSATSTTSTTSEQLGMRRFARRPPRARAPPPANVT